MNRREFLKVGGFGAASLAFAGLGIRVAGFWWDQAAAPGFAVLSADENRILQAFADALFPGEDEGRGMPNGTLVGVPAYFDRYLAILDTRTRALLRLLIHALDDASTVWDGSMTRFHQRPRAERQAIITTWDTSFFSARSGAMRSLKLITSMAYCEHPDVIAACGWEYRCWRPHDLVLEAG